MLNDKILNIILIEVFIEEIKSASKLVTHTQGIDHADDAVKACNSILRIFLLHLWNRADGLGDRLRFADTTCLNDEIVKLLHRCNLSDLLYEIHLESAAYTSILQCYERVILLIHYSTLLDKVSINVHFTDVIHDNGKLYTTLIREDSIEQRSLSTA